MAATADKLKIGLVLDTSLDPNDGVQQYVVTVGEWLRRQGHDVHYLVGDTKGRDLPNIHSFARNVRVRFNGNETTIPLPVSRRKLKAFLAAGKFDVLHVQTPHSPFLAQRLVLAADSDRTAIIGTFHIAPYNPMVTAGNRVLGRWLRPSLKRFDQIVSVSPAAADFARATFGIHTTVLPNVIDYDRFHSAKPWPQYDDGVLTILFLGRLVERKGCQTLLQAIAGLDGEHLPPFRVLICGGGPLESRLRHFISKHNLDAKVSLLGFISEADKPRYYASADIAVFPSKGGESFGIVLLEAMASGCAAVLAGDNPGYRSVMTLRPDLLFDPRDTVQLESKLRQYLTNAKLRRQAQAWGAHYTENFDVNVVGRQLLAIYDEALLKKRGQ